MPYILEDRNRTDNAVRLLESLRFPFVFLISAIALVIMLLVPSARSLVTDHPAFWAGIGRYAVEHVQITGGIVLSFAGTVIVKILLKRRSTDRPQ